MLPFKTIKPAAVLCLAAITLAVFAGYKTGENLVKNGGFELDSDRDGVPDQWTRSIQMPGAKAEVVLEKDKGGNCLKSVFLSPQFMLQARVFQELEVVPGKVYELSFRYRTGTQGNFKGDILLTGTGPIYRSIQHEPVAGWTRAKRIFAVPAWTKEKAALYVQNRSTVPIWYDDVKLCETDIDPKTVLRFQPEIAVQPVSSDDQLLMPGGTRKNAEFLIRLNLSGNDAGNYRTAARLLTGRDIIPCKVSGERVIVPRSAIPDGTSTLSVLLFDRADDTLVASTRIEIEKIPPEMLKGDLDLRKAAVFRDRDGKPFFPIGMYGLPMAGDRKAFRELREAGFNTVHTYSFEGDTGFTKPALAKKFLDMAQESGLKALGGLPRSLAEKKGGPSALAEWVKLLESHPAVLFYYADEMYCMRHTPVDVFESTYGVVRKNDPNRKFIPYDTPEAKLAPYLDGIMLGVNSANTAKLIRLRLGEEKPVFSVFGQADYNAGKAPTLEEMRCNVFMPVILGARGIFYWWYPTLKWHNKEKELLAENLYSATKELAKIAPALVSGEPAPAWEKTVAVTGGVQYCTGTQGGVTVLVAGVEQNAQPGTLEFRLPAGLRVETPWGTAPAGENGMFRIPLAPGEIRIAIVKQE